MIKSYLFSFLFFCSSIWCSRDSTLEFVNFVQQRQFNKAVELAQITSPELSKEQLQQCKDILQEAFDQSQERFNDLFSSYLKSQSIDSFLVLPGGFILFFLWGFDFLNDGAKRLQTIAAGTFCALVSHSILKGFYDFVGYNIFNTNLLEQKNIKKLLSILNKQHA